MLTEAGEQGVGYRVKGDLDDLNSYTHLDNGKKLELWWSVLKGFQIGV